MVSWSETVSSVLAVASIVLILVENFVSLSFDQVVALMAADGLIVLYLAFDLVRQARASGNVSGYLMKRWYEVVALTPMFVLYLLETQTIFGAVLRGMRLTRLLRVVLLTARARKSLTHLLEVVRVSRLGYLLLASAFVVLAGTFSAYLLEAGVEGARIHDFGDAFWWALATVTTVGYGDVVPVTVAGRIVGSILMVTGIAILGVFISSLGSAIIGEKLATHPESDELKELMKKKIDALESLSEEEVSQLVELINFYHGLSKREK
ncbi:MAG: potassium channel family protein [Aigarchaeota archaeon]|nr:potassium channel family protein [Candidatus Caldarchaeales archaeon]